MSSEQMLNMATSQSVTFAPLLAIVIIGWTMMQMPSPDEPLFCWATPLPRWGYSNQALSPVF